MSNVNICICSIDIDIWILGWNPGVHQQVQKFCKYPENFIFPKMLMFGTLWRLKKVYNTLKYPGNLLIEQ